MTLVDVDPYGFASLVGVNPCRIDPTHPPTQSSSPTYNTTQHTPAMHASSSPSFTPTPPYTPASMHAVLQCSTGWATPSPSTCAATTSGAAASARVGPYVRPRVRAAYVFFLFSKKDSWVGSCFLFVLIFFFKSWVGRQGKK